MEIIILLLVAVCILCVQLLAREWKRNEERLRLMEKRVKDLEDANRQRLPYKSFEEMMNAMITLDKEKSEMEFYISLIDNAKGHIANAMKVGTVREKK